MRSTSPTISGPDSTGGRSSSSLTPGEAFLAFWLAHEHSDLLYAYLGVGQVIDSRRNEAVAYQDALREAHRLNRPRAIQALEAIAPYPGPQRDFRKESIAHGWEQFVLGRPPGAEEFVNVRRWCWILSRPRNTRC